MKPNEPPVTDECVRLYHGTSDEAAASIMENGFRPLQVHELIDTISRKYKVSKAKIIQTAQPSFLVNAYRVDGEDHICFTDQIIRAEFWARLGSEARWEALRAVYALRNPEVGYSDQVTAEWAQRETSHTPTVVIVDVPYGELRNLWPWMPPTFAEWKTKPEIERETGDSAISMPVPMHWLVATVPVERTYSSLDIAEVAGISHWDVIDWIEEGKLPPSDGKPLPMEPIWWESTVEALLKAHQRST